MQVYPFSPSANFSKVGQVEFAVSVEELEGIGWLRCKKEVDPGNFSNCSVKTKKRRNQAGKRYKSMELVWRESNVAVGRLEQHNFQFEYQMQPRNDTATAVVVSISKNKKISGFVWIKLKLDEMFKLASYPKTMETFILFICSFLKICPSSGSTLFLCWTFPIQW